MAVLFLPSFAKADSAAAVIRSKDVYLASDKIYLRDIADFVNVADSDREKLDALYIKKAAAPGFKTVVTKVYVKNKVNKQISYLEIQGPEYINVYTSEASVPRADIEKAARDYIEANIPWKNGEVDINVKHSDGNVSVIEGTVLLKVKDNGLRYKGNLTVPVEIMVDGRFYKTETVSMSVKVSASCAHAAGEINRRETITPAMISMEKDDITFMPEDVITDETWLNNKSAKRVIMRGSILTKDMFESLPVFRRGANVTVIVRIKGISISTEGIAANDAREGDAVKVKLATGKTVDGKADASGSVIIEK